jgi:hypothetical protein
VQLGLGVTALMMEDGREAEKIFNKALETCDPASRELMLLGLVRAATVRACQLDQIVLSFATAQLADLFLGSHANAAGGLDGPDPSADA